ncbi:YiiD C-terminal domain-containing protein [Streptomyces sp. NPDC046261]|uniref:YiiD C-terminal domain-containing protein n=1 Tax=Streptomyces sp. NPDC046261 TaxID=3157200 RepID=UPI00340B6D16
MAPAGRWEISLNSQPLPSTPQTLPSLEEIRAYVNELVPFQKSVGVEVVELGADRAVAVLPECGDTRNHVGTAHAGALFLLAEAAAGAALAGMLRETITTSVFVLRQSRIDYRKKARGDIRAMADVPAGALPEGYPDLADGQRFEVVVVSRLHDADDAFVAEAEFTYHCRALPG